MYNNNPYLLPQYNNGMQNNNFQYQQYNPNQYTQPISQRQENGITGKLIESEEIAKTIESPLNGNKIFLPLLDGSKIIVKQLQTDGTTKTTIFRPLDKTEIEDRTLEYITRSDLSAVLKEYSNEEVEDIKDDINDLKKEIKAIKKGK